jgi:butyryl-CoA dehydrogenase
MDYFLNEEQKTIVKIARKITDERIIPARAELDEKQEFPKEIIDEIAKSDLFGLFIPEQYAGFGGRMYRYLHNLRSLWSWNIAGSCCRK